MNTDSPGSHGVAARIALTAMLIALLSFADFASSASGKVENEVTSPGEAPSTELPRAIVKKSQMSSKHRDGLKRGAITSNDIYSFSATVQLPDGFKLTRIDSSTELFIVFGENYHFRRTLGEAAESKIDTPADGGFAKFVSKSKDTTIEETIVRWDKKKVLHVRVKGNPVKNSDFNIVNLGGRLDGKVSGQVSCSVGFGSTDTGGYAINYGGGKRTRGDLLSWNVSGNYPVNVQKMDNYYNVILDYSNTSHREVGRQFALAIKQAMPNYESRIDLLIGLHMLLLQIKKDPLSFSDVISRAKIMYENPSFNKDYKDEISGMQKVFDYDVDKLGDGRLSKNELLIYQMFSEVVRPTSCSASAATGDASATGNTIVGRNWDWISAARYGIAHIHAITTFKTGDKTITNIGTLGALNGLTLFNEDKVFGAIINATTDVPYPSDLETRRSFFFDLRYAFENFSTLDEISEYMKDANKSYVYNHLILLADPTKAGVVENQVNNKEAFGNRSFRTDSSVLNPIITNEYPNQGWGIPGVFAAVNDFRLPNNDWTHETVNIERWTSFRRKYTGVSSGQRINIDMLKTITGYPGPNNDGVMSNGAIFNSEMQQLLAPSDPYPAFKEGHTAYTTMQSVIMDMNTMELWVHFVPPTYPGEKPPLRPTYQKIWDLPNINSTRFPFEEQSASF